MARLPAARAVAGAAVLALFAFLPAVASAGSQPAMCTQTYARDYAAPLKQMPRAHPPEGELPFGPRNFSIHRIERSQVVLEGSHFGYRFAAKNSGYRVLHLGWQATATLLAVDAKGRGQRALDSRRWRVDRVKDLDPLELAFPADHSGFFRVDLRFTTLDGHRLGSYHDYFRVLERSIDVELAVSAPRFHPGESAYGLIENRGAGRIFAPGALTVEHEEAGTWAEVPQPPNPDSVMANRWWMESGEVARCYRFDLPVDAALGLYRFSASVYLVNLQKRRTVTAGFRVVP